MPGISVSKICVPFGGGGINWSSYWSTRTPTDLYAVVYRDTEADLAWTDASAGEVPFRVYISTDGVNYTEAGTTLAGDTTYTATGLTAGTLYYFYVKAYSGTNESPASNVWDTYFKITVDTTKAGSADTHFVLPVTAKSAAAYYVDWGDGGAEEEFTTTGNKDHTYASSGTYQVKVRGGLTALAFNNAGDKLKLMSIDQWGDIAWSSMTLAFRGCSNLSGTYLDNPNTAAVTDMSYMFSGCAAFNQSVANFNTAAVTDMSHMFSGCSAFNQSVANFNTAAVTDMSFMFYGCSAFNQSVANFNTAAVTDMSYMFSGCAAFNQSVANFNTAAVTTMYAMFNGCSAFNQSVANFNTAAVTSMSFMFNGCTAFNQSVANFNTAAVTSMSHMFNGCSAFKQSLATFSLASVTDVSNMLLSCNINATGTTTNYDDTLVAWAAADVPNSLNFHGGTSKYSAATGAAARASLIADDLWTITDGGQA